MRGCQAIVFWSSCVLCRYIRWWLLCHWSLDAPYHWMHSRLFFTTAVAALVSTYMRIDSLVSTSCLPPFCPWLVRSKAIPRHRWMGFLERKRETRLRQCALCTLLCGTSGPKSQTTRWRSIQRDLKNNGYKTSESTSRDNNASSVIVVANGADRRYCDFLEYDLQWFLWDEKYWILSPAGPTDGNTILWRWEDSFYKHRCKATNC